MKKAVSILLLIAATTIISCSKAEHKKEVRILEGGKIELHEANDSQNELDEAPQKWHEVNSKICVLYGYGFNDSDFIQKMNSKLEKEFGLSENGGRILPLVYPNDFMYGKKAYISKLPEKLSNNKISGIVLLGAPENSHTALTKLHSQHENDFYFPIISLFPQDDDITGMEHTSDLVLDRIQKADMTGILSENNNEEFVKIIPDIIEKAIRLEIASKLPLKKDNELYTIAKELALGLKVLRYQDPDTNLVSINHFIIE